MRKLLLWLGLLLLCAHAAHATTYYVNNNGGSDSNNGTSMSTPFATIYPKAAHTVAPGDTVIVNAGNAPYAGNIFLGTSGTPSAWITYTGTTSSWGTVSAYGANGPQILATSGNPVGVQINGDYITWQGFNVQGTPSNTTTGAGGIIFGQLNTACSVVYHHIIITNNTSANNPGAGIATVCADYVTVTNNNVFNNANFSTSGQSGISIYASQNYDGISWPTIKITVANNVVHNNVELVTEPACGNLICDGEGIIIDDNSNSQTNHIQYNGGTLVQNNLTYANGSNGIEIGNSSNVKVYFNTSYQNGTSGVNKGEITARTTGCNIDIENNIMYSVTSGQTEFASNTTAAPVWNYNVLFNGTNAALGAKDTVGDPKFAAAPTNFALTATSPALTAANPTITVASDLLGNARPTNGLYNDGALQIAPASTKVPVPAPLTGTITINPWQTFDQTFSGITLACGKPFHFNVAMPPQYNGQVYKYPLYIWLHPDYEGDPWYYGGNTNATFLATGNEAASYNTTSWMTQFPAFYVIPYADQTNGNGGSGSCNGDGPDAVENWGGWFNNGSTGSGTHYSGDTGPNTFAILQMVTFLENQYSIDASRIYLNGFSLGAIGTSYLCQHYNILNGSPAVFAACLESGGGVDYADAPVTSTDEAIMQNVPTWYFSGASDSASPPGDYNTPLCNGLGGTSSSLTAITSATANRCGTSQMRYSLCPTCGHQETDANGNPVWTNIAMNTFAFAQGGGGGAGASTAQRSADFLDMLAVQGCLTGGGAPPCLANSGQAEISDLHYLGVTHYRSGFDIPLTGASGTAFTALLGAGISMIAGPPYPSSITPTTLTTTLPSNQIAQAHSWQTINPNAIFMLDGINEPGLLFPTVVYGSDGVTASNCTGSGGGGGDGCSWSPVVEYERDYVAAILADNALKNIPILTVSRAGEEPSNAGAQFTTVQGSGSFLPNGTVLGQIINNHVYPTDQQFNHSGVVGACQPNDPTAGNSFNIQTHWDNVTTFVGNFSGYATDALAQAQQRAVTEFGYPTLNPGPSANGDRVTEDKKGRCIMNGLLTAWQMGMKVVSIYSLYSSSGDPGFGLLSTNGTPNLSGLYLHNLTSLLADTGANARTFTPGSLTYAVTGLPSSGGQQLFEKSNGHFQLVLWNNATNWNMAAGTAITVAPVNVAVNFSGGTNFTMVANDTVSGAITQSITSGNAITVAVADYPVVIDVIPATGGGGAEAITVGTVAQQTAATPFTVSGTIANALTVPSLQYAINAGIYQALPASTGTRDPYMQPGSNASVWNTPFGTSATWSGPNDAMTNCICIGSPCGALIDPVTNFGDTVWTSSSASDPVISFTASSNGRTIAPDNGSTITASMHVPVGAYAAGPYPGNGAITLMDKTSFPNRVYTWGGLSPIAQLEPPGIQSGYGPFSGSQGEWDTITSDTYGQDYDTGLSGYSLRPGGIVGCDTDPVCNPFYPKIKHGLRFKLPPTQFMSQAVGPPPDNTLVPNGWPDRLEDFQSGASTYSGSLPFGMALGIPSTTAMPSGLDSNCQGLFWTMQHYPLIPRDIAGAASLHLSVDQVADGSAWVASARGCLPQLVGLLRVLTNQHQGGQSFTTQPANGPGPRSDTGPLPLSGSGTNVTLTSYFFTVPGLAAGSSNTVSVRDANVPAAVGTSNTFAVTGTAPLPGVPKSPLPSGYLHVVGNQTVDGGGNNVRLACTGYVFQTSGFSPDLSGIRNNQGFNCVRYDYYDAELCPNGTCNFGTLDQLVSTAAANNIKVIIDHHGNEHDCGGQQQNGLWYDVNSTTPVGGVTWNALTQNADGCNNTPTVTYAQFKANLVSIATHYAGNSTMIGLDLDNEAFIGGSFQATQVNWGGNNGADERLMCSDTGAAIEAADPGVLVICEGPINFSGPFLSGSAFPTGAKTIMDLSAAMASPVTLSGDTSNHVVYSIHDYPNSISGNTPDSGNAGAAFRITAYGALANTAPVWIGEIGADLDGTNGSLAAEQAWASMMVALMNGQDGALGGPTFTGCQQPMGSDWFAYDNVPGGVPDGSLNADGTNKTGQQAVWSTFLYTTCSGGGGPGPGGGGVGGTTWNGSDKSAGMSLSADLLTATDTVTANSNSVRTTTSASAGKLYFEIKATTSSTDWAMGLTNSTFNLALPQGLGGDANGIGFYNVSPTQAIYYNAAQLSIGANPGTSGDIIYGAVDLTNHLLWISSPVMRAASFPWNNSNTANPATGTGGVSFTGLGCPCFITFNAEEASAATLNAGGPFVGTVPTGFAAWQAPITSGNHPIIINLGN